MYTINNNFSYTLQKCQSCGQKYNIQYIGTQGYCLKCSKPLNHIQQQLKVVPKMYQSNSRDKAPSSEIKIIKYLTQFGNKYGGIQNDRQQIQHLYKQVLKIRKKKGISSKNYRQNSAVVIYQYFKDIHKLNIKQFCKKNQIQLKAFNKSYLIYQKITKQIKNINFVTNHQQIQLKNEQQKSVKLQKQQYSEQYIQTFKLQKDHCIQYSNDSNNVIDGSELDAVSQNAKVQQHISKIDNLNTIQMKLKNLKVKTQQIHNFIYSVFQQFFDTALFIAKKNLIINELTDRIIQMYNELKLILHSNTKSTFPNFYIISMHINDQNYYIYLLFIVMKKISHKVSQIKYKKVIQSTLGDNVIKQNVLKEIIKLFQNKQQSVTYSGDYEGYEGTTGSEFVKIQE